MSIVACVLRHENMVVIWGVFSMLVFISLNIKSFLWVFWEKQISIRRCY